MSITVDVPTDLVAHVGQVLGSSDWVTIDQGKVSAFAALTGDDHWIHVDVARANRELPGGKTLVHGFLTLALIPHLQRGIFSIRRRGKGLNYGCNRIRFTSPLPVDSLVRLHQTLKECVRLDGGVRITLLCTVEVQGQQRPALVAETIVQIFDES